MKWSVQFTVRSLVHKEEHAGWKQVTHAHSVSVTPEHMHAAQQNLWTGSTDQYKVRKLLMHWKRGVSSKKGQYDLIRITEWLSLYSPADVTFNVNAAESESNLHSGLSNQAPTHKISSTFDNFWPLHGNPLTPCRAESHTYGNKLTNRN